MEIYSLSEFNTYVRQVIALNFVDSIWITCEISQISDHRGNAYLDLVEKDEDTDTIKAQSSAAIWYAEYSFIKKKLGANAEEILQPGMLVKLKVEADFHVRYGFKLIVKDIDPTYTFGQLALQREKIIERLKNENRIDTNGMIPIPTIIQKIAVISSATAAGFKDFTAHLNNNQFGYQYLTTLYPAAMQGNRLEMEVITQLREIKSSNHYDVVVITRGGGSKLDLSGFDSYSVAKEISEMNISVITGIGHEIDESIADLVASLSFKTPTAVANYLIDRSLSFESSIDNLGSSIRQGIQEMMFDRKNYINNYLETIRKDVNRMIESKANEIENIEQFIPFVSKKIFQSIYKDLDHLEYIMNISSPKNILKKGYALVRKKDTIVQKLEDVEIGDQINIELADGSLLSKIEDKIK